MKIFKTLSFLKGHLIFIALGLLLFSYIKDAWYMAIVTVGYLVVIKRMYPQLIILILSLSALYYLHFSMTLIPTPPPVSGRVIQHHPTAQRVLIRSFGRRIWGLTNEYYPIGTLLTFEAEPVDAYIPDLLGAFDRPSYDHARGVSGRYFIDEISVVSSRWTLHHIPYYVQTYIDQQFTFMRPYLRAFFLADRSAFDEDLNHSVNRLGISHIFAISGLHITFLAMVLDTTLKKHLSFKPRLYTILGLLGVYGILVGFTPSFIRASFLFGFIQSQRSKVHPYTAVDGLSIIFIAMMLLRPYSLSDYGFVLSYLVTFGLLFMSPYLTGRYALFKVSLIAFMMTLPVLMWMHGSVNLSSLFFNTIYVIALTFLILPATYMLFFLPFLEPVLEGVITIFESSTQFFYHRFYWPLTIPFLYGFNAVIYYGIIGYTAVTFKKPHGYMAIVLFGMSLFLIRPLNPTQQITILDVDGDAMIFEDRFNRCVGLIDGGDRWTADNYLKHLKLKGYKTFDFVIVTHDHMDHTTGIKALLEDPYFNVKSLRTELTAKKTLTTVRCGTLDLVFYPFTPFSDKNNRSLVTGIWLDTFSVLIPGDIEGLAESAFIKNPPLQYTYLQLPHHGSDTSSSSAFLDHVNPDLVWANLPHRNQFNFPSASVIDRLNERHIPLITTAERGTFTIRNDRFKP